MNLLIFDYVSGGGYANTKLSSSILSEGYGMLQSIISDCKAAGHNVTTLLDSRLETFNPPNEADQIVSISSSGELHTKLKELSNRVNAVYIIAPESEQVLEKLVETTESSGGTSLNCKIEAIKQVSNKMTTYEVLKKKGIPVPETLLLNIHEKPENIKRLIKELGYPLVLKPLDGVSCSGLSLIKDKNGIARAIKKIGQKSMSEQFIAQKLIIGKAASACVISTGDKALAVTLNKQLIILSSPDDESEYYGGFVPFEHKFKKETLRVVEKTVEGIMGLKGYVGVDMVLTKEGPVVMEVNPRLTTSYIGLKRSVNFNPAQAIIDAVIGRKLPKKVQTRDYTFFSKVEVPSDPQIIDETYKLKDVISSPFPIEDSKTVYALIATSSTSLDGAQSAFYRTKKRLLSLYCRGD